MNKRFTPTSQLKEYILPQTSLYIPRNSYPAFDIDGTITNTVKLHETIFGDFLEKHFRKFSCGLPDPSGGGCYEGIIQKWADSHKTSSQYPSIKQAAQDAIQEWKETSESIYEQYKDHISLFPDAQSIIDQINESKKKISIITNATKWFLDQITETVSFFDSDIIDHTFTNETFEIHERKPSAYPMQHLSNAFSSPLPLERITYFGDSRSDIESAIRARVGQLIFIDRNMEGLPKISQGITQTNTKIYRIASLDQIIFQ